MDSLEIENKNKLLFAQQRQAFQSKKKEIEVKLNLKSSELSEMKQYFKERQIKFSEKEAKLSKFHKKMTEIERKSKEKGLNPKFIYFLKLNL